MKGNVVIRNETNSPSQDNGLNDKMAIVETEEKGVKGKEENFPSQSQNSGLNDKLIGEKSRSRSKSRIQVSEAKLRKRRRWIGDGDGDGTKQAQTEKHDRRENSPLSWQK